MAGRPEAEIDWNSVDRLLEAGCFTTEIAARFGISVDTLYRRCATDHNVKYTEYSRQKKANGESLLRAAQFKNAMKGNTTMQVWLGKQRLKQRDNFPDEIKTPPNDALIEKENNQMATNAKLRNEIEELKTKIEHLT